MSFLSNNHAEYLSARITQKGRNAIARGDFKISYFQVGDSEFDYADDFDTLTGWTNHQKVMAPFTKESGVKYPYKLDLSTNTTYGVPIDFSKVETLRNVMGPAGFVSEHNAYDSTEHSGTTVHCVSDIIPFSQINDSTTLTVVNGDSYQGCQTIALVFGVFDNTDPNQPVITQQHNSLVYKIIEINGNTLHIDRPTPNLSGLSGSAQIVCHNCDIEFPPVLDPDPNCIPLPIDPETHQNPWTLNIVWTEKPIGDGGLTPDEELSGYTSNVYISAKELFGYNSSGQTFTDFYKEEVEIPTSYVNSFGEEILVKPNEQRTIAIIHYSELGDLVNDQERFFKYDDYLSHKTGTEGEDISIVQNREGDDISDAEYFEVYIPFILYHRNTSATIGAVFTMDTTDYYIRSTKNERHALQYRYLLDEQGNKVGKVFVRNKVIVIDDQEIVAVLDYRSNRRHTLGAPQIGFTPASISEALISGNTQQTFWVTYLFSDGDGVSAFNSLPCNYHNKVEVNFDEGTCYVSTPSNLTIKFYDDVFQHMKTTLADFKDGFVAKKFGILIQETTQAGDYLPQADQWRLIDFTSAVGGNGTDYLNPTTILNTTIVLTKEDYENNSTLFDLETYMGEDYLHTTGMTENPPQFGDEQPFPGSVRVVRASDVEEMCFLVNLPCYQFEETQNPTYNGGRKYITEAALLDGNKEPLVVGKAAIPIHRTGTQVLAIRLDF